MNIARRGVGGVTLRPWAGLGHKGKPKRDREGKRETENIGRERRRD